MKENMIVIIVNECGEEVEAARYYLNPELELDEDAVEVWKERKVDKAWEEYPEARWIYVEDRRNWNQRINAAMCGLDWIVDEYLYGAP